MRNYEVPSQSKGPLIFAHLVLLVIMALNLFAILEGISLSVTPYKEVFVQEFAQEGMPLPWLTIQFLKIGEVLKDSWYLWVLLVFLMAVVGILLVIFVKDTRVRKWLDIIIPLLTLLSTVVSWLVIFLLTVALFIPLDSRAFHLK